MPGSDVNSLSVSTGKTRDVVTVADLAAATQVDLGGGSDEVTIATAASGNVSLTVDGGTGGDRFNLVTVGPSTSTQLNGDEGDDLFLIAGNKLAAGTTTVIDGGDPIDQASSIGDQLIFNPGDPSVTVNPSDPPPSGQVGIDDPSFGVVDFNDSEDVVVLSGPRIDISQANPSIDEGGDLAVSVTIAAIPQNAGVSGVTWSVADQVINNGNSTTLNLTWCSFGHWESTTATKRTRFSSRRPTVRESRRRKRFC